MILYIHNLYLKPVPVVIVVADAMDGVAIGSWSVGVNFSTKNLVKSSLA